MGGTIETDQETVMDGCNYVIKKILLRELKGILFLKLPAQQQA